MKKTSRGYDPSVAEKANTPFAKRFRELVTDTGRLREYLGCTSQAINQYKQGTAFPKTENLIKIADFYGVSVDYLLGRVGIPNLDTNMQSVHEMTGLDVGAISKLNDFKHNGPPVFSDIISLLIEDENAEYFLAILCACITVQSGASEDQLIDFNIDGNHANLLKSNLLKAILQSKLIENIQAISKLYYGRFSINPLERMNDELAKVAKPSKSKGSRAPKKM